MCSIAGAGMVCFAVRFVDAFMNRNDSTNTGRVRRTFAVTRSMGGCSSLFWNPTTSGAS